MTKKQTKTITVLSVIAFISAMLVSSRFWVRLDLTKNKAYTISNVSKELYMRIDEPVIITFYLSDKLRNVHPVVGEIEDTLREYTGYSRGRIQLKVIDPVKAEATAMAEALGLQPMQVRNIEKDQASFTTVYSGLVIEYLDKIDVLPFIFDTSTLEYDLTTRIRAMVADIDREIGVIVGDSFRQWDMDFRLLSMTLHGAGFNVREIKPGNLIPDNLPGLFVLGGAEDFNEYTLYMIDRYIQLGGKVMFAVKGVYVDTYYGTVEARHIESQGLLEMIDLYGAVILPQLALDRNSIVWEYEARSPSGVMLQRSTRYPLWISIPPEYGNPDHPLSAGIGLELFWASPLELYPPPSVNADILFTTSEEGWLQIEKFSTSPEISYLLETEREFTLGRHILGAAFNGVFPSFFAGIPKPHEDLPDMPASAKPSRMIVIGDVDFATFFLAQTETFRNLDFLMRAADWLINEDDVINIRSRQPQAGNLDRIQDPASRRFAMRFIEILNAGVIPLLVIILAVILASRRRQTVGLRTISPQTISSQNADSGEEKNDV